MLTLIRNADLYAPEHLGIQDILIANERIESIGSRLSLTGVDYTFFDAEGRIVTPGFIDKHVHVTGGGGEFVTHASGGTVADEAHRVDPFHGRPGGDENFHRRRPKILSR